MDKNYHAILGASVNASAEEIRSAYRRMVKKFHPDRFEGGSGRFMQIQEAYSVLGDSCRRRAYEQALAKAQMKKTIHRMSGLSPEPLVPEQRPDYAGKRTSRHSHSSRDWFNDLFEWGAGRFFGMHHSLSELGQSLKIVVPLTPSQAMRGGHARIRVPVRATCPYCSGFGDDGFFECDTCAGQGIVSARVPLSVPFPAGLDRDYIVVLSMAHFGIADMRLKVVFRV